MKGEPGQFRILGLSEYSRRAARDPGMYEFDDAPRKARAKGRKLPPWSKCFTKGKPMEGTDK